MAEKVVRSLKELPGALAGGDPGPLGWIGEGLALPRSFTVEGSGAGFSIEVTAELIDGRLRARSVCVTAEGDRGVTAALVRSVPVRQLMGRGARARVVRVELGPKATSYAPADPDDPEVIAAVEAATGYVAVTP
jgi:hypothetical protein